MSRLASFRGPSTPSSQPVASSPQPPFPPLSTPKAPKKSKQTRQGSATPSSPTPSSPRDRRDSGLMQSPRRLKSPPQQGETGTKGKIKGEIDGSGDALIHTQTRRILLDIRGCAKRWNELVNESSRYAKEIVDSRTRIENALALIPPGQLPHEPIVTPHMVVINEKIPLLENIVEKMRTEFLKMAHLIDDMEKLLYEAANNHGVQWAEKPLWHSWSLDRFATMLPSLLPQYARAQHMYAYQLLPTLRTSASSFEVSRTALARWVALSKVDGNGEGNGWFGDPLNRGWTWEEICAVEVEGWR